ncbi:MAG: hypothetical protein JWQ54_2911 [Mucilaginibacter sp.]|nr:hypothetical protein [Mucilaginibacter sp.]
MLWNCKKINSIIAALFHYDWRTNKKGDPKPDHPFISIFCSLVLRLV